MSAREPIPLRPGLADNGREAALVRRAQGGDRDALRELLSPYEAPLMRFITRMLGRRRLSDVHDVCQEVFVRIMETLDRVKPERPFRPYCYRIATNLVIDHVRTESRRNRFTGGDRETENSVQETPELRIDIERAILQLPVNYRTVLVLRYAEGLDYAEIGVALQIPINTVKTFLFRARRAMKDQMEKSL